MEKSERNKLLSRAQGKAQNRLRKTYAKEYREYYLEEVANLGLTIRSEASIQQVKELTSEIEKLNKRIKELEDSK